MVDIIATALPASPAWNHFTRAGSMIFVGGQVAIDSNGEPIGESIQEQTEATLTNLVVALRSAGADVKDVAKVNVFLRDWEDTDGFNEVYARFFPPPAPARTAIQAGRLGRRFLVEVDCIAVLGGER